MDIVIYGLVKVLLVVPHVFSPIAGSIYSSERLEKRDLKKKALMGCTIGNLDRHSRVHYYHASLGKGKQVVTRDVDNRCGVDLTIQVYTPHKDSLIDEIEPREGLEVIRVECEDYKQIPAVASRRCIEKAKEYDIIGYMEDDILIEDREFFFKIRSLVGLAGLEYCFIPHRCEYVEGVGDVVLSGDPDGGRPDLYWDTGEELVYEWFTGNKRFYRATNPHSGCFFLTKEQGMMVKEFWESKGWRPDVSLGGPLENACSGRLIQVLKLMKPRSEDYRFLMVRHQDELWKRHGLEPRR